MRGSVSLDEEDKEKKKSEPSIYATPVKRLWAWIGIVYMVILILANTYALATARYLTGIGSLAVIPALCGLGGTVILRYRAGQGKGGLLVCVLLSGACFGVAVWNLIRGLPSLLTQL